MKTIRRSFSILALLLIIAAMPLSSQSQVRKPDPTPASVGSGGGTYHFNPDDKSDSREYKKLDLKGYLVGQIVVKVTVGGECGGSFSFWKERGKQRLSGVVFVAPGQSAQIKEGLGNFKRIASGNDVDHEVYISAEFGGVRFMAKPCSNSFTYTANIEKYERYIAPKPYPGELGVSDYYDFRYKDFKGRHTIWGPTDYYKNFGEKYYNRFINETYAKLSPKGQQFLKKVGKKLQQRIEDKLKSDPVEFVYLEMNDTEFKKFAFYTHPDAYCESGWGDLEDEERSIISSSIDLSDLYYNWRIILTGIRTQKCVKAKIPM